MERRMREQTVHAHIVIVLHNTLFSFLHTIDDCGVYRWLCILRITFVSVHIPCRNSICITLSFFTIFGLSVQAPLEDFWEPGKLGKQGNQEVITQNNTSYTVHIQTDESVKRQTLVVHLLSDDIGVSLGFNTCS